MVVFYGTENDIHNLFGFEVILSNQTIDHFFLLLAGLPFPFSVLRSRLVLFVGHKIRTFCGNAVETTQLTLQSC